MSDPISVKILDLELYRGITYGLTFQVNNLDENGDSTGPRDLTGKEIALIFNGIFTDELVLSSDDSANDFGSVCQITAPGKFVFSLSGTQLTNVISHDGKWHIEERLGQDAILFLKGAIQVLDLA